MEIHVVSKDDYSKQAVIPISAAALNQLTDPESVRVRPILISLSSNNLSYAKGGTALHWWDAYPVPTNLVPGASEAASWGIVPAWGYAIVTESTTTQILPGTILWGFWPTADAPVDLKLVLGDLDGHWIEVSGHRKNLMTIYNHYMEVSRKDFPVQLQDTELADFAWAALFRPIWQTGYLLNRFVFPPQNTTPPSIEALIHPSGTDLPWTKEDAELSQTLLISLSASGKTARSFAYQIFKRPSENGPTKFLQVTHEPNLIQDVGRRLQSSTPADTISYQKLTYASEEKAAPEWLPEEAPKKVVIIDFGARGRALEEILELLERHYSGTDVKYVILQVGYQQKVYTIEESKASNDQMARLGKIRVNTSQIRDSALRAVGPKAFYEAIDSVWNDWLRVSHSIMPDLQVVWGDGVSGDNGIERGWQRLCQGEVGAQEGLVYRLSDLK